MNPADDTLAERYLRLWKNALPAIRGRQTESDPVLASGIPDARRGLTLIARPKPEVQERILNMLAQLRALEPEQHFYPAESLHVTILSLFTASTDHQRFNAHLPAYIAAVQSALRGADSFQVAFRGITASTGAIMVQGYPKGPTLEGIRTRLRAELNARGLAVGVDTRYRIITAHVTVMRFRTPLRTAEKFADALENYRCEPFGDSIVDQLHLIQNDWYASPDQKITLSKFRLSGGCDATMADVTS